MGSRIWALTYYKVPLKQELKQSTSQELSGGKDRFLRDYVEPKIRFREVRMLVREPIHSSLPGTYLLLALKTPCLSNRRGWGRPGQPGSLGAELHEDVRRRWFPLRDSVSEVQDKGHS